MPEPNRGMAWRVCRRGNESREGGVAKIGSKEHPGSETGVEY